MLFVGLVSVVLNRVLTRVSFVMQMRMLGVLSTRYILVLRWWTVVLRLTGVL